MAPHLRRDGLGMLPADPGSKMGSSLGPPSSEENHHSSSFSKPVCGPESWDQCSGPSSAMTLGLD
jgi:hypothetical protein